ncbi:hypothetical protein QCE48_02315 [Caballeronia sp. LZ024]|nr:MULTISPECIES: hypothetical protein [unclassified Caballeronia]MDR5749630.1 hypothetical protein [Caballeronia sp. LZ024]MDR5843240.1 hypothetical protein [Caballeronia sp. LZ031]
MTGTLGSRFGAGASAGFLRVLLRAGARADESAGEVADDAASANAPSLDAALSWPNSLRMSFLITVN